LQHFSLHFRPTKSFGIAKGKADCEKYNDSMNVLIEVNSEFLFSDNLDCPC